MGRGRGRQGGFQGEEGTEGGRGDVREGGKLRGAPTLCHTNHCGGGLGRGRLFVVAVRVRM